MTDQRITSRFAPRFLMGMSAMAAGRRGRAESSGLPRLVSSLLWCVSVVGFLCLAFLQPLVAAPQLTSLSFSPNTFDTTNNAQSVTVTMNIIQDHTGFINDDSSGIFYACINFNSPLGDKSVGNCVYDYSAYNGQTQFQTSVYFPPYSETGTWTVSSLYSSDFLGISKSYSAQDLSNGNFPSTVTLTGTEDITPPQLTGLSFSPSTIDITNSSQNVTVNLTITDDISGFNQGCIEFLSPLGDEYQSNCFYGSSLIPGSGTILHGQFQTSVNFPQWSETGAWTVYYVNLGDNAGNYKIYYAQDLTAAHLSSTVTLTGTQDIAPPQLTGLSFSPSTFDITNSSQTVTVNLNITDDASGFNQGYIQFRSPSGGQFRGNWFSSSSLTNGQYHVQVTFGQWSETGTWTVDYIQLYDNYYFLYTSNWWLHGHFYNAQDLTNLSLPSTLTVTGIDDTTPPQVTSLSFSPNPVNAPGAVTVTMGITDDLSGFSSGWGYSYNCGYNSFNLSSSNLISGNSTNGQYRSDFVIPPWMSPGTCQIDFLYLYDNAGNYRYYGYQDLVNLNLLASFTVNSTPDNAPPQLTGLSFPSSINVANAGQNVNVTLDITDDASGLYFGCIYFQSPSGNQQNGNCFQDPLNLISGNNTNGRYQTQVYFPQGSETGTWNIYYVYLYDSAGYFWGLHGPNYYLGPLLGGEGYLNYWTPSSLLSSDGFPYTLQVVAPPVAAGDSYSTNEDTTLTVAAPGVLGNDTGANTLTAVQVTGPANGTLTLNSNGSFTYTPAANFNGADSFTYKANDGTSDSNVATATITVTPVNDAPTANGQSVSTNEDTATAITLTGSDVETPAAGLTFTVSQTPAHGSLSGTAPTLTYTPNANYNGSDSFKFNVTDRGDPDNCGTASATCAAALTSTDATVTITVTAVNDAPTASGQSVSTNEDTATAITLTGSDVETALANLAFTVTSGPGNGTLSGTAPTLTYTPNANYNGLDSFKFKVTDRGDPDNCGTASATCAAALVSTEATVTITVTPVNDAPTANGQSVSTNEDTATAITLTGSDVETPAASLTFTVSQTPAHGSLSGTAPTLTYTPNANYNGSDSFKFNVTDRGDPDNCGTASATCTEVLTSTDATVTITVTAVNDAPSFTKGADQTVVEDAGAQTVTGWATSMSAGPPDESGQALNFIVSNNNNSLFSAQPAVSALGTLTYTLAANANGSATITVRIHDDGGTANSGVDTSAAQTFPITVNPVNDAPILTSPGNKSMNWGNTLSFNLSATDVETSAGALQYSYASLPSGATLSSAGAFSWTPTSSQIASYTVTFTVTDTGDPAGCSGGLPACSVPLSASQTITIAVNKRPTALVYGGDLSGQYSDPVSFNDMLTDIGGGSMNGTGISGKTIGLALGAQSTSAGPTNTSGIASTSLTLNQVAGSYNVVSTFAGDTLYLASVDSEAFTINKETITSNQYTGMQYVTAPSGGTANVQLSALITEQADGSLGDITKAKVKFTIAGDSGCGSTTVVNVAVGSTPTAGTGTASAVVSLAQCTYIVTPSIDTNSYYAAFVGDPVPLVVAPATGQFISGGGWIPRQTTTVGLKTGDPGTHLNFGFTVQWNKSLSNLQSNSNYIFRQTETVSGTPTVVNYQIKSTNAQDNLTVVPATQTVPASATFTSKAVIQRIVNGVVDTTFQGGNASLRLDIVDADPNGGTGDTYAITVWDASNNLFHSSNWNVTNTAGTLLGGGNVSVHNK